MRAKWAFLLMVVSSSAGAVGPVRILRDISVGTGSSTPSFFVSLKPGTVLFSADDGIRGRELRSTDGTTAGTRLVKEIRPGATGGGPGDLRALHGVVVFWADDGVHGGEPWVSDGTESGTVLLKDVCPGACTSRKDYPEVHPVVVDGWLYFFADDGTHGAELWKTDGTASNTVLVKDINPGGGASFTVSWSNFVPLPGKLMFSCDDGVHGVEPWVSDGTAAGTQLLADTNPGSPSGALLFWYQVGVGPSHALFLDEHSTTPALWRTDGTPGGTQKLTLDGQPFVLTDMSRPVPMGDSFVVRTTTTSLPSRLYRVEATGEPKVLMDLSYMRSDEVSNVIDGHLYFVGEDAVSGREPWVTDGTTSGTYRLADTNPGSGGTIATSFRKTPGGVMFPAAGTTPRAEPWVTDGTPGGTKLIGDLCPGDCGSQYVTPYFTALPGQVLYRGNQSVSDSDHLLVQSDGTLDGTRTIAADGLDYSSVSDVSDALPGKLLISANSAVGRELFIADVDQTPPELTFVYDQGKPNDAGWSITSVFAHWEVSEPESHAVLTGCDPVYVQVEDGGVPVSCTAVSEGGSTSASTVVRTDFNAPKITCPANFTAKTDKLAAANVRVSDSVDPSPTLSWSPALGSTLKPGENAIRVTASDAAGHSAACTYFVTAPKSGCGCQTGAVGAATWLGAIAVLLRLRPRRRGLRR